MRLDLHLHHLQSSAKHTTENIRVPQFVLCAPIVRKLYEVGKGVLIEDEGKLVAVRSPICDLRGYVEEDFEADLKESMLERERDNSLKGQEKIRGFGFPR